MFPNPLFPNPLFQHPFDDDVQRRTRLEAQIDTDSRRCVIVFVGGWITLIAFGIPALAGLPRQPCC